MKPMKLSNLKYCILIGAGGHGRVLLDALSCLDINVTGYADLKDLKIVIDGKKIPYLGTDEVVENYDPQECLLVNGLGSVGDTTKRRNVWLKFKEKGYSFARVVHPSAIIAADVSLGEGVQVMAGSVIQTGVYVGANSIINTRASLDHDCNIGSHVHIAPGVTLSGCVTVGTGTHIATGVSIPQGIDIPENSFLKMMSLSSDVSYSRRV